MKTDRPLFLQFMSLYFKIFGIIQFLFLLRNFIPPYGYGGKIVIQNSVVSLVTALVFTATHFIVSSESLDRKITIKRRVVFCSIPCAVACGYLALNFGLQSWLPRSANQTTAIAIWLASFVVSLIAFLLIFFLIERANIAARKKYDDALTAYKEKNGGVQNANCSEDQG